MTQMKGDAGDRRSYAIIGAAMEVHKVSKQAGGSMETKTINASNAPAATGGHAQAIEVSQASRLLFVSGQIPVTVSGLLPSTFGEQCRVAWANVHAQLVAANMTLDNLVKVSIFLSDRANADENRAIRQELLGPRSPALTIIVAGIFDEAWLIEIEAIAAA